jgi:hypothetical protein
MSWRNPSERVYMSERLVNTIAILEDAAHLREERLNGDLSREPDETTEDDIIVAMMKSKAPALEIIRRKNFYTRALRIMLDSGKKK